MKQKTKDLNVDFIGGQGPLTHAEEKALSSYFKLKKAERNVLLHKSVARSPRKSKVPA
jgi:hypothetical protein